MKCKYRLPLVVLDEYVSGIAPSMGCTRLSLIDVDHFSFSAKHLASTMNRPA